MHEVLECLLNCSSCAGEVPSESFQGQPLKEESPPASWHVGAIRHATLDGDGGTSADAASPWRLRRM